MTEISIAGETFNVLIEGGENKAVLTLSNPLGTNLHIWDPQIPALLKHFRVVRYDSRGHGASVANKGDYSVEGLGHDALAIMDALGVGKVHWLGLSMGGIIALWLLAHARERIGRAVLANGGANTGPDLWNSRIQTARDAGMDTVAMAAAERWFTKAFRDTHPEKVERVMEMVRTTPLPGYLAACAAGRDMDLREAIRSITNKVLHRRAARSIDTARNGRLGRQFHQRLQIRHAGSLAYVEYRGCNEFHQTGRRFPDRPRAAAGKPTPRPKAPAKTTVAKKAPNKRAAKKSSRSLASAKKAPVKSTPHKKRKTKTQTKKAAAKKTTIRTVIKKKPGKKMGASKKRSDGKKIQMRKN